MQLPVDTGQRAFEMASIQFNPNFPTTVDPQLTCRTFQPDSFPAFDPSLTHGLQTDSVRTPLREPRQVFWEGPYTPPQLSSGNSSATSSFDQPSTPGDFSAEGSVNSSRRASTYYSPCPRGDDGVRSSQQATTIDPDAVLGRTNSYYPDSKAAASFQPHPWLLSEQYFPQQSQPLELDQTSYHVGYEDKLHDSAGLLNPSLYHIPPPERSSSSCSKQKHDTTLDFPSTPQKPLTPPCSLATSTKGARNRVSKPSSKGKKGKDYLVSDVPGVSTVPLSRQSGDKQYVCDILIEIGNTICKKRFTRQEHCKRHQKIHDPNKKKLLCPLPTCEKEIETRPDNMKSHLKNTHYTPTNQKENQTKINKREGMMATLKTAYNSEAIPRWIDYLSHDKKLNNEQIVIHESELPRRIREDDIRWVTLFADKLTIDHRITKQKFSKRQASEAHLPPLSNWWKMVDYPIEEAMETLVKDFAPEYLDKEKDRDMASVTLWDLDPRRKALEAGTFKLEHCDDYLRTSMRDMQRLGLQHLDPRWIALREGTLQMNREEAIAQGILEHWEYHTCGKNEERRMRY